MRAVLATAVAVFVLAAAGDAAAQGRTYAVLVTGLGGAPEFTERFHDEASRIQTALVDRHGLQVDRVTYLGERVELDPDRISSRSTRDNVLATLARLASRVDARPAASVRGGDA